MNYYLKKTVLALTTLLIVSFVLFALVRVVPGNPFPDEKLTIEQIEMKREELGLNDPLMTQYVRYMSGLLKGDFGKGLSLYEGVPIKTVLGECLKNSLQIGALSVLIGVTIGILLGVTAAYYRGTFVDHLCSVVSLAGVCIPSYVFLIYIQKYFVFKIHLFPAFFDSDRFLASAFVPAFSMALFSISRIAKFTRNEMVDVLNSDFIRLVESKGIYGPHLIFFHVMRNALIPIITVIAPIVVDLLTGAAVVEKICGINGIGRLMVEAISGAGIDYNYVLVLALLYSAMYIGIMFILDILYGVVDPRIREAKGREA